MSFLINSFVFDSVIPTDNLVLYMRFNNSVTDQTGNHTPTTSGTTYGNGIYTGTANGSILYNSSSDYVNVPDSNLLSFGDGSTDSPASWMLSTNYISNGALKSIFWKRHHTNGSLDREYTLFIDNSDRVSVQLWDHSTGATLDKRSTTTISTSTNYHIIITYDGSSSSSGIKIYFDGVEESSYNDFSSGTYTAMENGPADLRIGQWGSTTTANYNGYMDDLGIFDKELSQAEVTAIYNKISGGDYLL